MNIRKVVGNVDVGVGVGVEAGGVYFMVHKDKKDMFDVFIQCNVSIRNILYMAHTKDLYKYYDPPSNVLYELRL